MEKGGSYWYGKEKSSSLVQPGDIAIINPGQPHSGKPVHKNQSSYKMIYLNKKIFPERVTTPELKNVIKSDQSLSLLFLNLYKSVLSDSDRFEKEIFLTEFTGAMMSIYSYPSLKPEQIGLETKALRLAGEFLSENLEKKVTLDQLAKITRFSPYHVIRVFKKHMGITPHIYRTQKRIELAKELILRGFSLSEIALSSGFTDQSHLTNTFKKYTGVTPGQYFTSK